jgi:ribonuclease BN (tRNA processing enzyme)
MSLVVTVLGTSARFQTLERACSSYLVEIDGEHFWLDAGGGTWLNLQRSIRYQDIDGVLLTHAHPDHTIDVFQAYHARQYGQTDPLPPIPLWAPQETLDRLVHFSSGLCDAFDLRPVGDGDKLSIGESQWILTKMAHPAATIGIRIEYGEKVVAFSSDTGEGADFESLAGGADIFFCEASSQDTDEEWDGHLRASQAAVIATRIGVKRMLLTHLPPDRDLSISVAEAKREAPGLDIDLAEDGMRLELA